MAFHLPKSRHNLISGYTMINRGQQGAIGFFEEVLGSDLCETILQLFSESEKKETGAVYGADGSRKSDESKISIDLDVAFFAKELRDQIHAHVMTAFWDFQKQFPSLRGLDFRTTGYKIQKYEQNKGQFVWHSDATTLATFQRQVAMVLYLNDVEEGGETEFYYQDIRVPPRRGCCIFFPPFWTHRHRGTIPRSNDKYVITSFFERHFEDAP